MIGMPRAQSCDSQIDIGSQVAIDSKSSCMVAVEIVKVTREHIFAPGGVRAAVATGSRGHSETQQWVWTAFTAAVLPHHIAGAAPAPQRLVAGR